jgi:hypothetical protein
VLTPKKLFYYTEAGGKMKGKILLNQVASVAISNVRSTDDVHARTHALNIGVWTHYAGAIGSARRAGTQGKDGPRERANGVAAFGRVSGKRLPSHHRH